MYCNRLTVSLIIEILLHIWPRTDDNHKVLFDYGYWYGYMNGRDPLAKEQKQFKCTECAYRTTAPSRALTCRRCGGVMKDAAIPT